ncbi:Tetratricopeptide repeat-containing protein [Marinobacter daqiaonensis]|uniref:Tetratricopeptide repeat-containing protein n=1 Tax=Marinobacter daqiaonensis TaxID=650891 RepID=A0A1I6JEF7_9GAMM|nr:tetratricopeptide repeat protein [Marinobacter daqiaonensis]SFR77341.1 Tetratricopeptide repeat-containing protein [Marinobacter daqiaonensis]
MQAQYNVQVPDSHKAEVARLLIEANLAYSESNHPQRRYIERIKARQGCRQLLNQALTMQPDHAGALGLLGRVEMDDGELDRAASLFESSLKHQPEQPQQYCNLGYWALKTERPAKAEAYFLKALDLDRQSAAAFCGVAHAKREQGQFDVAYLHYRKLIQLGMDWPSVYSGMLKCAARIEVHQANHELALDAIALLRREELPHQEIGRFCAAILRQQYDLDNPNAEVFLDAAAEDELLILALEKTLMPDAGIEELVTLLRRSVLAEVAHTVSLRDELQPLTLAVARYVDRTGYALVAADDEQNLIDTINNSIAAQFAVREPLEALVGSVMVSAMYGALFHQDFAVQLGQWSLTEWPAALQGVMAASYYDRALDEATKQNFEEKADELCLARSDVPQAWPSWNHLAYHAETSLKAIMAQELGLDTADLAGTLRMMICGAQSGQRALELAHYLDDVEVIAVDESLANVATATRRAEELGLTNIVFWPWSVARRFVADGHQVHWIEVGRLPSPAMADLSLAALVSEASTRGAVVHMHTAVEEQTRGDAEIRQLIRAHNLQPTRDSLRRLRRMALNNRQDPLWQDLLKEEDFYGLGGCRDRWFRPQDVKQLKDLMGLVSNEVEWKLVKASDQDGHSLALAPVARQVRAEALGSQVQSLVGQPLSVYFVRRR